MYDLIVIGGGASGLMASVVAQRKGKNVLLIEKQSQCGLKLRITGKGQCNLTNTLPLKEFLAHCGSEPRFLYPSFNLFFNTELIDFFSSLGVKTTEERGGRIYPSSHKAQDIFLSLINTLEESETTTILKNTSVKQLLIRDKQIIGVIAQKEGEERKEYFSKKVILATGGKSYPLTGSTGDGYLLASEAGHNIIEPIPSLVGFKTDFIFPKQLINFTVKNCNATITLSSGKKLYEKFGDLTFEEDAIAGPIILTLSRLVAKRLFNGENLLLQIDFKPAIEEKKLDEKLIKEFSSRGTESIERVLRAFLPNEMIAFAIQETKLNSKKQSCLISSVERKNLLNFLKHYSITIQKYNSQNIDTFFSRAVVTQGGVSLKEINPKTLESKLVQGLYFCGEVMDLDADTGGYNLQIAFSTAFLAAQQ